MAETLNPNPTTIRRQRPPMAVIIQSPTSPFFLGSNDDQLERAHARAEAHAVSFRRKSVDVLLPPPPRPRPSLSSDPCLNREQIIDLFHNCVKLASENKINQKNTWELKLIDHLSDIIKVEAEDNAETNFQKASCTLEAGVKIYAVRVDAWHADAYRVLSRISRAGLEDEQGTSVEGNDTSNAKDMVRPKKETDRKPSPLSTVESSFETFNVKKFDVAFSVDPLYHQTSVQFDEGEAKGLLLYNLGVYGRCWVVFDPQEVPAKCISPAKDSSNSDLIDISFARECIEKLVTSMHKEQHISPSLRDITEQFAECSLPSRVLDSQESIEDGNTIDNNKQFNASKEFFSRSYAVEGGDSDYVEACSADHHDYVTAWDEGFNMGDPIMQSCYKERVPVTSYEHDNDGRYENVASFILRGLGHTSIQNEWAGADHWKFRKPKGPGSASTRESGLDCAAKRTKSTKSTELDIHFSSYLDEEMADIFVPSKHPESLLLPRRNIPSSNTLPEDCHYQPEDLVKLFLLPNIMCLGLSRRVVSGSDPLQSANDSDEPVFSWIIEDSVGGQYDDGCNHSVVEQDILVSQLRRVDKIEVQYDQTSKQVDVQVLKETLWNHMQGSVQTSEMTMHEDAISFRHVLATFPDDCQAAATHSISPHLCFICILHLANEYDLTIEDCPSLDDLNIYIPAACQYSTTQVK